MKEAVDYQCDESNDISALTLLHQEVAGYSDVSSSYLFSEISSLLEATILTLMIRHLMIYQKKSLKHMKSLILKRNLLVGENYPSGLMILRM